MSVNVVLNGTTYVIPEPGDSAWGQNLTSFLTALPAGVLQKAGGTFSLTAEIDFGSSYGIKSVYFKSRTSNVSSAGVLRLANADSIGFRNSGNSADLLLTPGADGILNYNSVALVGTTLAQTLTNKTLTSPVINTPTGITKSDVGLGNVDNTSDATKNAAVATLTNKTLTSPVINSPTGLVKADVGLGNVDNTSDATKNAATATLTNKTIDGSLNTLSNIPLGTATGTLAATKGGTGVTSFTKGDILVASNSTTLTKLGIGSDGQVLVADSSQTTGNKWTTLQQGNKNYITYGNFENGATTGWSAVGCASLTNGIPTSVGSGGAAFSSSNGGRAAGGNTTAPAVVSSGQLAGSYSLNLATSGAGTIGDGYISQAYNLDIEDQAKMLSIRFAYKSVTGSPNMSGTSSNTYAVAIYDLVNNAWINPQGAFNFVQSSGVGIFTGTFQSPANMVGFQIFIYSPVAPVGASALYLDDFSVGPQIYTMGPAVGDWVAYTPTITGFGTPTGVAFKSRRVGDSLEIVGNFQSGTNTAVAASFTLGYNGSNGNVSIDASKIAGFASVGWGTVGAASTTLFGIAPLYDPSTQTVLKFGQQTSTTSYFTPINGSAIANAAFIQFYALVPIVGWSSNTSMSQDTDTRVVAAYGNSAATTIGSSYVQWNLASPTKDTHGAVSSNAFTAPVSGFYDLSVTGSANAASTYPANYRWTTAYSINSTSAQFGIGEWRSSASASVAPTSTGSAGFYLNAGDVVRIFSINDPGNVALSTASSYYISRRSGPAVVAASESVGCRYTTSSQSTSTSASNVILTTKDFDTHNAYNTSTGVFTVPVSGIYTISGMVNGGLRTAAAHDLTAYINIGGSVISGTNNYVASGSNPGSIILPAFTTTTTRLAAGQTISLQVRTGYTGSLNGDSGSNYLNITRVGN
jgi:hypothetical protein